MGYLKFIDGKRFVFIIVFALLLGGLVASAQVQAQGGIAMSGSFSQQVFQIPQGSSTSGPSIDVVIFNTGSDSLRVKMTTQVPLGVNISISNNDFTLASGGQQKVLVGVEVTKEATPGEYEIGISAESYTDVSSGIHLAGSTMQTAKLVVLGDFAMVSVQAKSPDGQSIEAMVRLYRIIDGQNYEVAYSENGAINQKVAPGDFIAISYIGGQEVAEQSFTVATDDVKTVSLSGATVFFEAFGVVPNYQKDGGKLAFVQLVYTVNNLYQKVDKAEVILSVSRDASPAQEVSLITLNPLEMGRVGLNYNYVPADDWKNATYTFKLQLKLDDKVYANSQEQQVKVTGFANSQGGWVNPAVIVGIAVAFVVAAGVVWFFVRKRRRI